MYGRHDDVRGRLARELYDPLAEVCLDGREALAFERGVQVNLLGRHALRLDDPLGPALAHEADDYGARFGGVARPVHLRARALRVVGELREVLVQVRERLVLDCARPLAQTLPVVNGRDGDFAPLAEGAGEIAQSAAQLRVAEGRARVLVEGLCGLMVHAVPF